MRRWMPIFALRLPNDTLVWGGVQQMFIASFTYLSLIDWLIEGQVVIVGRFLFQLGLNAPIGAGVALLFRRITRKTC
jgi:hypothetical protein